MAYQLSIKIAHTVTDMTDTPICKLQIECMHKSIRLINYESFDEFLVSLKT